MAELVLATANEALRADPAVDLGEVTGLLATLAADARPELEYWRSLVGEDEFPLGAWLRRQP